MQVYNFIQRDSQCVNFKCYKIRKKQPTQTKHYILTILRSSMVRSNIYAFKDK